MVSKPASGEPAWNDLREPGWQETAHWPPAKRRWRTLFATTIFLTVFCPFYFIFARHWLGLLLGWMPASGLAGLGYYSPRQLGYFLLVMNAGALKAFLPAFWH